MFEELKQNATSNLRTSAFSEKDSMWIEPDSAVASIVEMPDLSDEEQLIEYLLDQFAHTDKKQLEALRIKLKTWVRQMKDQPRDEEGPTELRDFIYEMF